MKVKATHLCLTLCDPVDCNPPTRLLCPWNFPGKNTGVDCHFLPQGIFPTQGSNPHLLHCKRILYQLSYQENPKPLPLPRVGREGSLLSRSRREFDSFFFSPGGDYRWKIGSFAFVLQPD